MITKRNRTAIMQYAQSHQAEGRVEQAFQTLENILPLLGPQSHSRAMINRLGTVLLQEKIRIIAPSCPDYSHSHGQYNFCTVGGAIPLLSQLHIKFLETIAPAIPHMECEIVVADQEADDAVLCRKTGQTRDEFLGMIHQSIKATREHLLGKGWIVTAMTERFPELRSLELTMAGEITNNSDLQSRITHDAQARSVMYQKLGVSDFSEMRQRTIRTASQYCALAHIAARDRLLVCNHETVNLGWYNQYGAAVLHNPVSVY